MNIFEKYGGYKKAKEKRDDISHTLDNSELLGGGDAREGLYERLESIDKALLEYRRQRNIYEVGDWIVMDSHKPEYQLYQITKDDMGSQWINLVEFRHATDEEIKAGKRRPEMDSDTCSDIRNHVSPLTKVIDR